jgi:hypothetical protein
VDPAVTGVVVDTGRHRVVPPGTSSSAPTRAAAAAVHPLPTTATYASGPTVWTGAGDATVYVTVGNTDAKLTRAEWLGLLVDVRELVRGLAGPGRVHGDWHSAPEDPWLNHCWCAQLSAASLPLLRSELGRLARRYRQDSIALAVLPAVEFVRAG